MNEYPWLSVIYRKILDAFSKGVRYHALLFNSQWDNGEDILIKSIIYWLMCTKPYDTRHCGECDSCRLMNANNHPDYYEFDVIDTTQSVGIDSIRECINFINKCAFRGTAKVIFIKYVEYLTEQANNTLLKVIEEPPSNTYFFLKSKEYTNVPWTLLSRCIRWNIIPPQESTGLQWLLERRGVSDVVSAKCALRLCHGAPVSAGFILQEEFWKNRSLLFDSIGNAIICNDFLRILPNLKNNHNSSLQILWLITLLVDALKWDQNLKDFMVNLDQINLITVIANNWDSVMLSNQLKLWVLLVYFFEKFNNLNRELLLTYRLLNWQHGIIESYDNLWST